MAAASFWDFAVIVYGRPGIQDACLDLQDRFGADIPLVLFCLWLADCGFADASGVMVVGMEMSGRWQKGVVAPLRHSRQALKIMIAGGAVSEVQRAAAEALRERVKACELDAERFQIEALEQLVAGRPVATKSADKRCAEAAGLLDLSFSTRGITLDPLGQGQVLRILDTVFGA